MIGGTLMKGGNLSTRRKPCPSHTLSSTIPRGLAWGGTLASTLSSGREVLPQEGLSVKILLCYSRDPGFYPIWHH